MLSTYPHDGSGYLGDGESQILLLDDALSSGNIAYLVDVFGIVARARGMTSLALAAGIECADLYRALEDQSAPDLTVLTMVIKALGVRTLD
ncbi:MAG: addiction module antidote protein [Janthinobacterium lividum]